MVDFNKLRLYFPPDVYKENFGTYKTSQNFTTLIRNAPVLEEGDHARTEFRSCNETFSHVSQKLTERKKNALITLNNLFTRIKQLLEQEEAFQQRFITSAEQVILNGEKKKRALARINKTRITVKEQNARVEELKQRVLKLRQFKDNYVKEIKKHCIYEEFLQSTLYDFGVKGTLNDILTRYRSLESKKRYLTSRKNAIIEKLQRTRHDNVELVLNYYSQIMNMMSHISLCEVRYEKASKRTSQLECLLTSVWECCAGRLEDITLSTQGIDNLNQMMQKTPLLRKKFCVSTLEQQDMPQVINQVVAIKNTMRLLVSVMEDIGLEGSRKERTIL
ncbi:coiled-coil domain-containing protein 42 homolog [Harmonia axyridis]|uniref:coiled-coil domain-containing protein 42 homolog n=1 Tax=Harmonia axyridis TaxID=115357 RepID=UPI001E27846D|nr:coiled-coil domain-containing protein 42 homolog [Harmonia axyridis]